MGFASSLPCHEFVAPGGMLQSSGSRGWNGTCANALWKWHLADLPRICLWNTAGLCKRLMEAASRRPAPYLTLDHVPVLGGTCCRSPRTARARPLASDGICNSSPPRTATKSRCERSLLPLETAAGAAAFASDSFPVIFPPTEFLFFQNRSQFCYKQDITHQLCIL